MPARPLPSGTRPAPLIALLLAAGCGNGVITPTGDLALEEVASGLNFPLLVTAPPGDATRLFVVEKRGVIRLVKNGSLVPGLVLDYRSRVSGASEQGMLGLAFHPGYASNRLIVVSYTDTDGDTRISTMRMQPNGDVADPATENVILALEQPFANHNGGNVVFGPQGYLFIGLGDGGNAGDPGDRARDPGVLLGKLLRLEVDGQGVARVPPDNPFVGTAGHRGEIWSLGLRNPWRFAFDRANDDLYIADVGQSGEEEINVTTGADGSGRGRDYGWSVMEGTRCFKPPAGCDQDGLTMPVLVYDHSEGCSVTGGFVYRGGRMPEVRGTYFYGDFCGGWVRSFRFAGGQATEQREWPGLQTSQLTSFGEDATGELYVASAAGRVYRIVPR